MKLKQLQVRLEVRSKHGTCRKDGGWRIPDELWKRGLLKYDKLKGIDGSWLAMDVANVVKKK